MPKLVLRKDPTVTILGTLEVLYGVCPAVVSADGTWTHSVGTDVDWNSQRTVRFKSGQPIFVADNAAHVSPRQVGVQLDNGVIIPLGEKLP